MPDSLAEARLVHPQKGSKCMCALTDQDIADLRLALIKDRPAFYKDDYSLTHAGNRVAAFLRRNGVKVDLDPRTGALRVERPV